MIAVVDYGVGNLFSLRCSLEAIGEKAVITRDREVITGSDHVILPGVGAFGDALAKLRETGMFDLMQEIAKEGKPMLGICVGMQLLFEKDLEFGEHEGLALLLGTVDAIEPRLTRKLDIPQMGWNALKYTKASPIFEGIEEGTHMYFVHSYAARDCESVTTATCEYEIDITAAVQKDNVFGTQFHPEKSGPAGLKLLKNFCTL